MSGQATTIRDLERDDIDGVARLFQKTFRGRAKASASLNDSLEQSFLRHPWDEPGLRSKVAIDGNGHPCGFIGIVPARLELEGRNVLAAFAGSMMVDDPKANPLVGARLLRAFLAGPQDISLTETANATALNMWQKLGHPLDPAYSLNWLKVLRPVSTGVQLAERTVPALQLARPLGRIADRAVGWVRRPAPLDQPQGRRPMFHDVTRDDFARALLVLKDAYPLRPRWDAGSLDWFVRQAEQKRSFGYPEWRVADGPDGRPIAAYAYFASAGGIGWVLQAVSLSTQREGLVDDLFAHAHAYGCAALRGAAHPWLVPALMQRRALFVGRAFYVAHARDKTLLEPVKAGQALISGLAGESWMRLIGDRFDL
ncbi:hypothetical protein ACQKKX_16795 [Neorhizobium sp. NPDC001467]|uniref:hypothetical protein n=1 Tax=Neorhizobium sp. NPDC001467 TaxID=3390595 RepID=UPI003D048D8B